MTARAPSSDRPQRILDAAAAVLLQLGYAKTTMGDIAAAANISRGMLYLAFPTKEALVDAVLAQEVQRYVADWRSTLEQRAVGTLGGVYRAVQAALAQRPLLSALLANDRRILGRYVQQPASGLPALATPTLWLNVLNELQAAGALRADCDPLQVARMLEVLSAGLLHVETAQPLDPLLEQIAAMLDHFLIPADGGNQAAGRAIIQALAQQVQTALQTSTAIQEADHAGID